MTGLTLRRDVLGIGLIGLQLFVSSAVRPKLHFISFMPSKNLLFLWHL